MQADDQAEYANEIQKLEALEKQCKAAIELQEALLRLERNPDFIKIITEGYLSTHALGLISYAGKPGCYGQQEVDTFKDITSIGKFSCYLANIHREGQNAVATVDNIQQEYVNLNEQCVGN